jgi:hypothetical protein
MPAVALAVAGVAGAAGCDCCARSVLEGKADIVK